MRETQSVPLDAVIGVLCVYLLLGMFFALRVRLAGHVGGKGFFAQGVPATIPNCTYYSFTTLATIGYGDLTAATNLGHTLSVSEGLLGQVYLVTVVSLIVGNLGRRRPTREQRAQGLTCRPGEPARTPGAPATAARTPQVLTGRPKPCSAASRAPRRRRRLRRRCRRLPVRRRFLPPPPGFASGRPVTRQDQALAEHLRDQVRARAGTRLEHRVAGVGADGVVGDLELVGDLGAGAAERDQADDLELAARSGEARSAGRCAAGAGARPNARC